MKAIKSKKRDCPCYIPYSYIYIDYTGEVMPCCNLRSDIPEHKKFVLGNVKNDSLIKIFNNKNTREFRKKVSFSAPDFSPCNECTFGSAIGSKIYHGEMGI